MPNFESFKLRLSSLGLFLKTLIFRKSTIFIVVILILGILGFVFKGDVIDFVSRNFLRRLRDVGLLKPSVPGYFLALKDQNPLYDYNGDGAVDGNDYGLLLKNVEVAQSTSTTSTSGSVMATAEQQSLPSIKGYGNDAFNGSVSTNISFKIPSGTAGLTPSLNLSYSSSSVDDMFAGVETKYRNGIGSAFDHSYQKQASYIGLGWGLGGLGTITRDDKGTLNDWLDDTFMLTFPGGGANLMLESGDNYYSVFRTVPNIKIKAERWGLMKKDATNDLEIWRYHWVITTGDGTKYYFGYSQPVDNWWRNKDFEQQYFAQGSSDKAWYPLYGQDQEPENIYSTWSYATPVKDVFHLYQQSWLLTKVESVHKHYGNTVSMDYVYDMESGEAQYHSYTKTTYPVKITYGYNQVLFEYEDRLDKNTHQKDNVSPQQTYNGSKRLKKLTIQTKDRAGSWRTRNAYTFGYAYGYRGTDHPNIATGEVVGGKAIHSLLTSVTEWSGDPSGSGSKSLPSQTFSYGSECAPFKGGCPLTAFVDSGNTQVQTPNDFFLRKADNGFGGSVSFEYYQGTGGNALPVKYCDPDKLDYTGTLTCKTDHAFNTQRHRLNAQVVSDGMGNTYRTEIAYPGSGTAAGLAYVDEYGDYDYSYQGVNCCNVRVDPNTGEASCNQGSPSGCHCPGDYEGGSLRSPNSCSKVSGTDYCQSVCNNNWGSSGVTSCGSSSPCSSWGSQNTCYANDIGCYKLYRCASNCKPQFYIENFSGYEFLGYPEVETTVFEKNSTTQKVSQSKSYYYQALDNGNCFKPSPLKGMSYKTVQYDVNNSGRFNETETWYKVRFGKMFSNDYVEKYTNELNAYCGNYDKDETISLVMQIDSIGKTAINNSYAMCTRSTSNYQNLDGSVDHYALPHKQYNWGKVSCTNFGTDDTSDIGQASYTNYTQANTSGNSWILPKVSETWASDDRSAVKYNHQKIYYDNQMFGLLGQYGNVTSTETLVNGNVYQKTTTDYETDHTFLVWQASDAMGNKTLTNYDGYYHLYPTSVENALGQRIFTEYDFSTQDTNHPNYNGILGLPVKTKDANGAVTTIVYDAFGRALETYLPGRTPGTNTPNQYTKYYYFNDTQITPCDDAHNCIKDLGRELGNNLGPHMMVMKGSRIDDSGTFGRVSVTQTYYNGLGQVLQSRQSWLEGNTSNNGIPVSGEGLRDILTSTSYNALGNVVYQSLPYSTLPLSDLSKTAFDTRDFVSDASIRKSQTKYDGLGRPIETVAPDGTSARTVYESSDNPLVTKILGPNCNDSPASSTLCTEQISESNVFGQALKNTLFGQETGQSLVTESTYHSVLGGILSVKDPLGIIVSELRYDDLGRKVNTWNIDMSP